MNQHETIDGYIKALSHEIESLSFTFRLAFAAWLAERFLPFYLTCCEKHQIGVPDVFRQIVDIAWRCASGERHDDAEINKLFDLVVQGSAGLDDYPDFDAIDACQIVGCSIQACNPTSHVLTAASAARVACERAAAYVDYDIHDEHHNKIIWQDPVVQYEVRLQSEFLAVLKATPNLDADAIRGLQKMAREQNPKPNYNYSGDAVGRLLGS